MLFLHHEEHYSAPRAFISVAYKQRIALGITAVVVGHYCIEVIRYYDRCHEQFDPHYDESAYYVLRRMTVGQLDQILYMNGLMPSYTTRVDNGLIQACIAQCRAYR